MSPSFHRLARAAVALTIVVGALLPAAAQAQSGPAPNDLLLQASALGDGFKTTSSSATATKAEAKYQNGKTVVEASIEVSPSKEELDKMYALVTVFVAAFGATVEPAPDFGPRGLKITMTDPAQPNLAMTGYIWPSSDTVAVSVGVTGPSLPDAEALALKGATAQKALLSGASLPPAPAAPPKPTATPVPAGPTQADAKLLAIGLGTLGKGWQLAEVVPGTGPGGEYDAIYKPTDPSSNLISAEIDVFIPNDPAIVDAGMQQILASVRSKGWAASPTDYYGDRMGIQATLGTATQSGQMYVFVVGNTIAAVTVLAKPEGADEAAELAEELADDQEEALE